MVQTERRNNWPRVLAAFAIMFAIYQASEGLQTVIAPGNPLGPVLMLAALLVAWPLGRWLGWRGYDAFGLQLERGWIALLVGGVLLAVLAKLSTLALAPLVGAGHLGVSAASLTLPFLGTALLTTFVPSVAEDILTRGFLLRTIPRPLGPLAYVVGSAALYTANHIWRLDWGVTEQVRLFCLGLAYGAAAWRWRSLWGAVALHWGWNLADASIGPLFTLNNGGIDAGRLLSGGAHLALLAIVLSLPPRRTETAA
jgi:membrane protease YdiL (CAAX protease family)